MKKCSNAQHPHCTYWVMSGEQACEGGHAQAEPSSYDLLSAVRSARASGSASTPAVAPASDTSIAAPLFAAPSAASSAIASAPSGYARPLQRAQSERPQLHISGFDPRAAGGRQTLKMELRGMPDACAPQLTLQLQSDLIPNLSLIHI